MSSIREWAAQQLAEANAMDGTPAGIDRSYYWATRVEVFEEILAHLDQPNPPA